MDGDLKRLAGMAEGLEAQARELREGIEKLAQVEPVSARVDAPTEPEVDDSEARIVAFSMVLDGRQRDEVAERLAAEFGLTDSGPLLDDLYARAG